MTELVQTLNQQLQQQRPQAPKFVPRQLTAEDEFRLVQDLSMTPTKAMREWFESEMGMTFEDFREHHQAAREADVPCGQLRQAIALLLPIPSM